MDERSGATAQAETKKPISESIVTAGGILSISPRQYRQYADEWKAFTSRASSDGQRKLGQIMVEIWLGRTNLPSVLPDPLNQRIAAAFQRGSHDLL
jgi:hypothetical protein